MLSQQFALFNRSHIHIFGTIRGNPHETFFVELDPVSYVINAHWQRSCINLFICILPLGQPMEGAPVAFVLFMFMTAIGLNVLLVFWRGSDGRHNEGP